MKVKITVPTSLNEITLKQYKHFVKIQKDNTDDKFLQTKMIETFCDVKFTDVMKLKFKDSQEICKILTELFEQKPELVKHFKLDNIEYGFNPSLDDLSLGEYIDLDTYIGDWDNIEKAMNVLYRPITNKYKHKYSIEDYKVEPNNNLLNMPMDAVTSSIFFFYHLGMELSQVMLNSLENNEKAALTDFLNSQKSGGGITQFTDSLKEILHELNISPN
tara:strand:+ start:600 stop:1250 length:651 start_codon:yes stop_codon:yes gene_type:complete